MGQTLTNWVVDSILKEDIKKEVVVYAGRFQHSIQGERINF